MESTITILIYIHAFFGGIALIAGIGIVILKKGTKQHKLLGKVFSYGMIISSAISMPIALMPVHKNPFLFSISLFTIYLILTGQRALLHKGKKEVSNIDKVISMAMILTSSAMLFKGVYGITQEAYGNILYLFFGGFGLLLSLKDFKFYSIKKRTSTSWLRIHISKMLGAFISSITAFIIAGLGYGDVMIAWILPSIIGTIYILYSIRNISGSSSIPRKSHT